MNALRNGFTLIELMITVAIVGILASIAGPAYLDYTIRSQVAEGLALSSAAKAAVTDHYQYYGVFPADNNKAGISTAPTISGDYVSSVTIAENVITIRYGNNANAQIFDKTIALTADATAAGSLVWTCANDGATQDEQLNGVIQDEHLPTACE